MTSGAQRRVGRPSLVAERRAQLVGAFIELIARDGLERVTLDDVAGAAGLRRSALNHFIGNREDLIVATVDELSARYETEIRATSGARPGIEEVIDVLFGGEWIRGFRSEDAAFDALLAEAARNPRTRNTLRAAYEVLIDVITAALRRSYPQSPPAAVRETGYAIACLIEQNITFQQLGFPRTRIGGARKAALVLAASLARP